MLCCFSLTEDPGLQNWRLWKSSRLVRINPSPGSRLSAIRDTVWRENVRRRKTILPSEYAAITTGSVQGCFVSFEAFVIRALMHESAPSTAPRYNLSSHAILGDITRNGLRNFEPPFAHAAPSNRSIMASRHVDDWSSRREAAKTASRDQRSIMDQYSGLCMFDL